MARTGDIIEIYNRSVIPTEYLWNFRIPLESLQNFVQFFNWQKLEVCCPSTKNTFSNEKMADNCQIFNTVFHRIFSSLNWWSSKIRGVSPLFIKHVSFLFLQKKWRSTTNPWIDLYYFILFIQIDVNVFRREKKSLFIAHNVLL